MLEPSIDRRVLSDISWWHWALTVPMLAAHLSGVPGALGAAMLLCAVVGGYFYTIIGKLRPYPVQIRLAYLGLLLMGTLPGMQWAYWVQLVGTTAMVTVGYCPLARMLNLVPLNREEPLTRSFVWRVFFQDPCVGGIVQWSAESDAPAACCALPKQTSATACSINESEPSVLRKNLHATAH